MRTDEDNALARVQRFATLLRAERFAEIVEFFTPALRGAVSSDALRLAWTAEAAGRGGEPEIGEPSRADGDTSPVRVRIPVKCADGGFTVVTSVGDDGLLRGLRFEADGGSWRPPRYAEPERFTEQDIVVGHGPLAVPGTLSMPVGTGPWPAVVLLGGGGAFDRDESVGPNKPLKDLAWGLASQQVAVLRFDKITFTQPGSLPSGFTMADEYLPYALDAVRLLRERQEVDSDRVHLLGHSMGGKVAPRAAAADPSIAGLVLLAADAQPMHEAAVRVVRHLAARTPGPDADEAVAALTRQAALVAGPELVPGTPSELLPFGLSAAYWLDLRAYDPVATAAGLTCPMLILQGGRDYQVTVADDLTRWQRALADRPEVAVRVHPDANHFFFSGRDPSTPAEYTRPDHVDASVVGEIASWLTRR
ncbi:alpha/beta hydrolase family protein [Streptomyces poriferorum]|uniref:Alpha/beta fold hydrolase n=1 Tax=Streptomyces poriferorum TaxID=2798799 RepID=A0ABY9IN24_9ACTN|nr:MULTISPECIES: alpha/beta fold hydrolase [unclassified Streptomyces]MDP5315518.1 alpha/beta fold hydrolase [Streptomyces sp. Alt4]WLQ55632.1 alpha/beta fold hydrolase [Streptomyces sp. Alt2]